MRKTIIFITAVLLNLVAFATAQKSETGNDLLQQAQKKVYEERDFDGAVQIYDRILREFASDRALAGRAAVGRVQAKESTVRAAARKEYEDVIRNSANPPALVEAGRTRLADAKLPVPEVGVYIATFDQQVGAVHGPVTRLSEWETQEMFPAWSPDGKWMAVRRSFASQSDSAVIRSLDNGRETVFQLTKLAPRQVIALGTTPRLEWLRNEGILVVADGVVYLVDPEGGSKEITHIAPGVNGVRRGNRGSRSVTLAATTISPDGATLYLIQVAVSGGQTQSVIVAFNARTGESQQVFSLPADATTVNPIRPVPMRVIAVSPDGRTLAMVKRSSGPNAQITSISVNGDEYRVLATGEDVLGPVAWSADSTSVIFAKAVAGESDVWRIMQVPANGGDAKFTGLEVTGLLQLDVSPDGTRIAFDGTAYRLSTPGTDKGK